MFERASDAVVAFGPGNLVYANSLVFDFNTNLGLRSGIAINVSKDGGLSWGPPVIIQDDNLGGLNDKNWIVVDMSDAPGHHYGHLRPARKLASEPADDPRPRLPGPEDRRYVASNQSTGQPAQRGREGLPTAAVDPDSGTIYAVWDDSRYRTDGTNDVLLTRSFDNGLPVIDTYDQESPDGGGTSTVPFKVDSVPSNPWYDAFSREGSFEGDYDQVASAGGYTYVVRCQGAPASANEPAPLVPNPDGPNTLVLTEDGKGHQHQSAWVALVQDRR